MAHHRLTGTEVEGGGDVEPIRDAEAAAPIDRRPFTLGEELMLATLPTATMLLVLVVVEQLADQRLLFASLASSAFLIYVDPGHVTNRVRTLVLAHGAAATIGVCVDLILGTGYLPAAISMTVAILVTLALRAVHPPAISTALTFAFRPGDADKWAIFMAALALIAMLVILQPLTARLLARVIARRRTRAS